MLEKLVPNDDALRQRQFMNHEVQYNLVHRIIESESATCLKTADGQLIFAQSQGHNGWLWMSRDAGMDRKKKMLRELAVHLNDYPLRGVSGEPDTAKNFAEEYSKLNNLHYRSYMEMESYKCPEVKKPLNVRGRIRQATQQDVETVAQFMAGFSEGAYGVSVDPASQRSAAEGAVGTSNLYLWLVDGVPVSMANIAHRSPRHGRINAVFTPPSLRKKGYASAIVAELGSILDQEGLIPMLYADLKNPDSNKIYKNIGFVEAGKIADIRFVK